MTRRRDFLIGATALGVACDPASPPPASPSLTTTPTTPPVAVEGTAIHDVRDYSAIADDPDVDLADAFGGSVTLTARGKLEDGTWADGPVWEVQLPRGSGR